jgi:RHH-type transcriptional regulator, rel operon repressor / antitoxin RelB
MTITIRLDDQMDHAVTAAARAIGVSKSEFVRQCLRERLDQEASLPSAWELGKELFGKYSSDRSDLSRNAKQVAREKIHARKGRR